MLRWGRLNSNWCCLQWRRSRCTHSTSTSVSGPEQASEMSEERWRCVPAGWGPAKHPINLLSPLLNQGSRTNQSSLLQQDHFQANTLFLVGCFSALFAAVMLPERNSTSSSPVTTSIDPLNSRTVKNAAVLLAKLFFLGIFVIIGTIFSIWQQLAGDHGLIDVIQVPKDLKQPV